MIREKVKRKPVDDFKVDCPFGNRTHPISKKKDFHNGIDISLPLGTKCYGISPGKVLISGYHKNLGWYLVIDHDGFLTVYCHLKEKGLAVGKLIKEGDVIGYVGSTGSSSGPHLHFEIRAGKYVSNEYFWNRGKDGTGSYPNAFDPMEVYKEIDEIEDLVSKAAPILKINNQSYWVDVIKGDKLANPEYIKQLFINVRK